jgi:hypothetical protein
MAFVLLKVGDGAASKGNKMRKVWGRAVPQFVWAPKVDGAIGRSVLKIYQGSDRLAPPAEWKAGGGEHGSGAFHGGAVAALGKRVLLWGVRGGGVMLYTFGGEEVAKVSIHELATIVRDN